MNSLSMSQEGLVLKISWVGTSRKSRVGTSRKSRVGTSRKCVINIALHL